MTALTTTQRVVFHGERDRLLAAVAGAVELSKSQWERAIQSYEAVGSWLAEDDGDLAGLHRTIFAQGSMALGTTVRPVAGNEFDIDLMADYAWDPTRLGSGALYDRVLARLKSHGTYREILEEKPNCIRLNYRTEGFHLDVVPACENSEAPGHLIRDASASGAGEPRASWRPTDPRGYQAWFRDRCRVNELLEKRAVASVEPVPEGTQNGGKLPLQIIVQLVKQTRNVTFGTDPGPSSILLTTLCANHYRGDVSVVDGLSGVVARIDAEVSAAAPSRIVVPNPAHPHDDLVSAMDDATYARFVAFVNDLMEFVDRFVSASGIPSVKEAASSFLGTRPVSNAVDEVYDAYRLSDDRAPLRTLPTGAVVVKDTARRPRGVPNPDHTFHCEP